MLRRLFLARRIGRRFHRPTPERELARLSDAALRDLGLDRVELDADTARHRAACPLRLPIL